jgi:hypothetical protein
MKLMQWIAYQRTFGIADRWERRKEKLAQFIAWHCLPERVRMWVIIRAHANCTSGKNDNVHPDDVKAFDLTKGMCKRA